MIITSLEPRRGAAGRTDVYADGRLLLTVPDDVAARLELRVGQAVDEATLGEIALAADLSRATDTALRYLEARPRTRREIETRLRRGSYSTQVVDAVLAKLVRLGLVDDADFAARWVEHRAHPEAGRPIGRRRLAADLLRKGVERDVVDEAVEAVDDERERELARAAARARIKAVPDDPEERLAARRRLSGFLARRGFGWAVVEPVLREIFGSDD